MMDRQRTLLAFITLVTTHTFGMAQPHITGSVHLDRERGLFQCDFELSNLPEIARYSILLNHGMNIKSLEDSEGKRLQYGGFYDGNTYGEALAYYVADNAGDTLALPDTLKMTYSGAYPVYEDEKNAFDFKGYVAINEQTIRAAEQTKWYPVLYDLDHDQWHDAYTYDIEVSMEDGSSLFLNGSPPVRSRKARFKRDHAVPLFLFAGDFDFIEVDGDYIINASVEPAVARKIIANVAEIKEVYKDMMQVAFTDNIYLINHQSVKEMGPNEKWGFNVYPAFAFAGYEFENLLYQQERFWTSVLSLFCHELAHNYFGLNARSGMLYWFWLESVAEYMAMLSLDDLSNKGHVKFEIKKKVESIAGKDFVPLSAIEDSEDIDEAYRYKMGPLILKVFEGEFGKDKMVNVLRSLYHELETDGLLTLESLEKAALASGVSPDAYTTFYDTYLSSPNFEQNVQDYFSEITSVEQ